MAEMEPSSEQAEEVEKIEVEIGGETKQLTPAELERLQAQLTLKRPKPPSTVNTKEEQDAPPEPVVSKSQVLHQAYKRARVLDVHQGVISPSETPAPSMPVDAQGMTFEADTIEALKAALKEYHETQIAPSLNHIHQILQQHRVAIPKDVATRLKLLDLSSNMAELAVTRRSLLLTNLPAFVTWPAVTQNLDWLMQKVGLQRDSDIQSITQHIYSADKMVLRVTFVTESACKSVHQFLRTRPYYWHDRSSYDDIKIKTERDFTTAERIQRIPLFTLLDFFGHADMAPYKNISLACDWNTLQVWLPVTSTNEEKLIAQVVYLPIDPKPLCAFFVESTPFIISRSVCSIVYQGY